jgi:hypothetical protein
MASLGTLARLMRDIAGARTAAIIVQEIERALPAGKPRGRAPPRRCADIPAIAGKCDCDCGELGEIVGASRSGTQP